MSHLITFNCTEIRPQSDFFIGFHSTFCACTKGLFSIKTQFYDLVCFISMNSMFVPNLEPISSSSQIKDTKYHFFSKWQNNHFLSHLRWNIAAISGIQSCEPSFFGRQTPFFGSYLPAPFLSTNPPVFQIYVI